MHPLQFPMLWLVLAQLMGILIAFYFPDLLSGYLAFILALFGFFLAKLARWAGLKDLTLLLSLCLLSVFWTLERLNSCSNDEYLLLEIKTCKKKPSFYQYEALDLFSRERVLMYAKDSLGVGYQFYSKNELQAFKSQSQPFGFNYANYLKKKGIQRYFWLDESAYVEVGQSKSLGAWAYRLQQKLSKQIDALELEDKSAALYKSLLLGDRSELSNEDRSLFTQLGISHVLAVSGLHVGAIYLLLHFIFKWLSKPYRLLFVLMGIWLFAAISGFSPSVSRASFMFSFMAIAKAIQRRQSSFQAIYLSAFVLLLINPLILFSLGFQLSYLAVLGIVYFHPKWMKRIESWPKIIQRIMALIFLSIAAQLATFPITQFQFHQFPLSFLLSNIWVVPLISLILYTALPLLFLSFLLSSTFIGGFLNWLAGVFHTGINFQASLWSSVWYYPHFQFYHVIIMYAIIIYLALWWLHKQRWAALASLSIVVILSYSLMMKNLRLSHQQALYLFNQKGEFAMVLIDSGKSYVSSATKLNEDLIQYLRTYTQIEYAELKSFYFQGKLYHKGLPSKLMAPEEVDVYIVSAKAYLNQEDIQLMEGKELVIYGRCSEAKRRFLSGLNLQLSFLEDTYLSVGTKKGTLKAGF